MRRPAQPLYRPPVTRDLLALPLLKPLRGRYGRLILQAPLAVLALLLVWDGFTGPQVASRNLATVLPWVQYRGVVVLALLLAGNLFCMGCPFTLPRTLAKRLSGGRWRWPRALRSKWLAIASLLGLFFAYEYLDLWASPALTAWLIVAYFVASFVLEAAFEGSPFCKYVCPLGTFNFAYSTLSPTQIGVKQPNICATCTGRECLNGSYAPQISIHIDQITVQGQPQAVTVTHGPQGTPGCGLDLFPPQLTSNLDCTLCLDCVRACPHENVGLLLRPPGHELGQARAWRARWDVSLLVVILAGLGVLNAFAMTPLAYEALAWLAGLGLRSEWLALGLLFGVGGLLLPVGSALLAGALSLRLGQAHSRSLRAEVAAFVPAFVPLGFGIWLAHYGFHFLIAPLAFVPIVQEFLGQRGDWATWGFTLPAELIGLVQVVALAGGFLWSMSLAQRAALRTYGRQATLALLPWAALLLLLAFLALQVFAQPMEMRGTELMFG
jgi:ferredoxin